MRVSLTPALLFASLALSGCLISPEHVNCRSRPTCESCITLAGCGWCPGEGCVGGSSLGPEVPLQGIVLGNAARCEGDYRWDECRPRTDECEVIRSCLTCDLQPGCFWCDEGRFAGVPVCTRWTDICRGEVIDMCREECTSATTCGDCNAIEGCEYCPTGTFSGTCDQVGFCEAPLAECPFPCNLEEDCGSCNLNAECQWCSTAPFVGTCGLAGATCSDPLEACPVPCDSIENCVGCLGSGNCEWYRGGASIDCAGDTCLPSGGFGLCRTLTTACRR